MYHLAIRQFAHTLESLDNLLGKAVAHAQAKKALTQRCDR